MQNPINDFSVECCLNNTALQILNNLKREGITVNRQYCLQRCGVCHDSAFLIADGELIVGDSHMELIQQQIANLRSEEGRPNE